MEPTLKVRDGNEVSTTCGSGWVNDPASIFLEYEVPIIDPPATAGGTATSMPQESMKVLNILLLFTFAFVALAQTPASESAMETMVATERAFANTSEEKGTNAAFLAFIADDGILFRPKAVKGKQWLTENPPPASDKRPWLNWEPSFAFMSQSGDMGYTFGPWEYRRDIKDAEAVAFGISLRFGKSRPDGPGSLRLTWEFRIRNRASPVTAAAVRPVINVTS